MSKIAAFGASLIYDPSGTAVTVGQARNFTGPGLSRGTQDVTTHDSAYDYREHIPTLKDGGEVSFEVEFDPENSAYQGSSAGLGIIENLMAGSNSGNVDLADAPTWRLQWKHGSNPYREFRAWVTRFEPSTPIDGSVTAQVTMKVTGRPSSGEAGA